MGLHVSRGSALGNSKAPGRTNPPGSRFRDSSGRGLDHQARTWITGLLPSPSRDYSVDAASTGAVSDFGVSLPYFRK